MTKVGRAEVFTIRYKGAFQTPADAGRSWTVEGYVRANPRQAASCYFPARLHHISKLSPPTPRHASPLPTRYRTALNPCFLFAVARLGETGRYPGSSTRRSCSACSSTRRLAEICTRATSSGRQATKANVRRCKHFPGSCCVPRTTLPQYARTFLYAGIQYKRSSPSGTEWSAISGVCRCFRLRAMISCGKKRQLALRLRRSRRMMFLLVSQSTCVDCNRCIYGISSH